MELRYKDKVLPGLVQGPPGEAGVVVMEDGRADAGRALSTLIEGEEK